MKLLELCCGENSSWSKAGRALGYECTTLDWNPQCGADFVRDVRDYEDPEGYYDIVAASPDCRELSRARSKKGNAEFADEVCRACAAALEPETRSTSPSLRRSIQERSCPWA